MKYFFLLCAMLHSTSTTLSRASGQTLYVSSPRTVCLNVKHLRNLCLFFCDLSRISLVKWPKWCGRWRCVGERGKARILESNGYEGVKARIYGDNLKRESFEMLSGVYLLQKRKKKTNEHPFRLKALAINLIRWNFSTVWSYLIIPSSNINSNSDIRKYASSLSIFGQSLVFYV